MPKKKDLFQNEKEIFLRHVQNKGLRRTSQRDLILDVFLRLEDHLTSEDVYWLARKEDESIGQTTVYRTLKLLTEAGIARETRLGDGKTYYERHFDHEHHDHMICSECGLVIEFFSPELEAMQDQMAAKYNFKPTHHSLRILGFCEDCQKKEQFVYSSGAQPRVKVAVGKIAK